MGAESGLQRRIRRALEAEFGGYWFKVWGGPFQPAGLPDLAGCVKGRAIFIEVKTKTGKVSPIQRRTMARLVEEGAIVGVATSAAEAFAIVRAGLDAKG